MAAVFEKKDLPIVCCQNRLHRAGAQWENVSDLHPLFEGVSIRDGDGA
jgi:hypothetical protein